MAYISKITTPDGTEYDLKDAEVPSWAKTISKPSYNANEVGALSKSGGDMTGGIRFLNGNSQPVGGINCVHDTNGADRTYLIARNIDATDNIHIGVRRNSDDTLSFFASNLSKFRSDMGITPANIGAHPANTNLIVLNNTDYSGNITVSQSVAQIKDTDSFIRHQLYGICNSNGSFYTCLATRRPNGSSAIVNQISLGFDADGNGVYIISHPAAFRDAIKAVQGIALFNSNYSTWADVYAALTALDAYTPCTIYVDSEITSIVSDGKITSGGLFGTVITNKSTTIRLMVRNQTGNVMYNISITNASDTNRMTTVYKFTGTEIT